MFMIDEVDKEKLKKIINLKINIFTSLEELIEFIDVCEVYHLYDKVGNRYYTAKRLIRNKQKKEY